MLPSLGPQLHIENHVSHLGSLLRPSKAAVEKPPLSVFTPVASGIRKRSGQKLLPGFVSNGDVWNGTRPSRVEGNKKWGSLPRSGGVGSRWIMGIQGGHIWSPSLPQKGRKLRAFLGGVWHWGRVPLGFRWMEEMHLWSPYQCIFEDECPFFKVGYGSSLQGMESSG